MADQGSVGKNSMPSPLGGVKTAPSAASQKAAIQASTGHPPACYSPAATEKFLTGTVKENGVAVARKVRAYHRATGRVLGETTSNTSTGAFSLSSVGWTDNCYVVALDDLTVAPDYNAVIYDLVIPV